MQLEIVWTLESVRWEFVVETNYVMTWVQYGLVLSLIVIVLDFCWLIYIGLGQSEVMALIWCNIVATLKERDQLFYGYPML